MLPELIVCLAVAIVAAAAGFALGWWWARRLAQPSLDALSAALDGTQKLALQVLAVQSDLARRSS